jgi:hypothetical protein
MAGQRADAKDIAADLTMPCKFGDVADIDQQFRREQTQIHRGHQALAARKHLRAVAMLASNSSAFRRWLRVYS